MKRPTGSGQIAGGVALLIAGGILFLLSMGVNVSGSSGGVDPDAMMKRWAMLIIAGSATGISFLLLATGWILRAIYFLPGRQVSELEDSSAAPVELKERATTQMLVVAIVAVVVLIAWAMNGA